MGCIAHLFWCLAHSRHFGGLSTLHLFPNWPTGVTEYRHGQNSSLPQASHSVLFPKWLLPLSSGDSLRKWLSQSAEVCDEGWRDAFLFMVKSSQSNLLPICLWLIFPFPNSIFFSVPLVLFLPLLFHQHKSEKTALCFLKRKQELPSQISSFSSFWIRLYSWLK